MLGELRSLDVNYLFIDFDLRNYFNKRILGATKVYFCSLNSPYLSKDYRNPLAFFPFPFSFLYDLSIFSMLVFYDVCIKYKPLNTNQPTINY